MSLLVFILHTTEKLQADGSTEDPRSTELHVILGQAPSGGCCSHRVDSRRAAARMLKENLDSLSCWAFHSNSGNSITTGLWVAH
jgi:hypothetical protein